jgi:hypothetical protein
MQSFDEPAEELLGIFLLTSLTSQFKTKLNDNRLTRNASNLDKPFKAS